MANLWKISVLSLFFVLLDPVAHAKGPKKKPKAPKPTVSATVILERFQKAWDETQSYQANFRQVITTPATGTRDESEGTLYVVKPSKLRWESKTEGSIQILNAARLTVIQENKRRKTRVVDIYPNAGKALDSRSLSFLSGKARFADIYEVSVVFNGNDKADLKLVPKEPGKETFIAEIDKNSYLLRALVTESVDSRVRLEFSDIKTNVTLAGELFEYKPRPEDVVNEAKQ